MADNGKGKPRPAGAPRDGRRTRWEKHRTERRAEFVAAALRVLSEVGPEFGIEQVALEAGVTKPVLYRHFSDKADLVAAMGERATETLLDRLIPALNSEEAPLPRIRKSIDAFFGLLEEFPNLYWVLVRHTPPGEAASDVVTEDKEIIATALSALLGDYMRSFDVDSGGAEPWAFGVVGFVQATAEWWLERRSMSRESVVEYLAIAIWSAIDGFARQRGVSIDPNVPLEINRVIQLSRSDDEGYRGPATLTVDEVDHEVRVRLVGHFQPIDGRFHWYGRVEVDADLEAALGGRKRPVRVVTGEGSADGEIADPDPWGRYRLTGTSTPPFRVGDVDADPGEG